MNFKKNICILYILLFIFFPVYSFADDITENDDAMLDIEASTDLKQIPAINARHAVIFDRASKTVLYGKNENEKCKMASTTKILTAIVVIENASNLDSLVTVSKKAARHWRLQAWAFRK